MPPVPTTTFANNNNKGKMDSSSTYSTPSSSSSLTDSFSSSSASSTPTSLNKKFKADTIFVFDYDDTLLCSSHLCQFDLRLDGPPVPDEHRKQLDELDAAVVNVLSHALELTEYVHLITNAETGWVELSSMRYLPKMAKLLPRLQVLSARSKYEPRYPNQPLMWKIEAFRERINESFNEFDFAGKNVISLGDSYHEREALHVVTSGLPCYAKSVKFVERPSLKVLVKQLELVKNSLNYIATHEGSLDLMLSHSLLFNEDEAGNASGQDASYFDSLAA